MCASISYFNVKSERLTSLQNPLGKFYLTTSSDIDGLREAFTFDGNSVSSYELGKPRHTRKRSESLLPENDKKFDIVMETSLQLQDALGDMQTEIQKVCSSGNMYA
jgi:hypothetical protein